MSQIVTAVYEKGVLRPLQPVKLREHQKVWLEVLPGEPIQGEGEVEAAIRRLVASGRLTPPSGHSLVEPVSEHERRELADRLGRAPGKTLSEIIIEERGDRLIAVAQAEGLLTENPTHHS